MYYSSGTGGTQLQGSDICFVFIHQVTALFRVKWRHDHLTPSISKNNPAKFHPDPIWNGGVLGLLKTVRWSSQQEEQEEEAWRYDISCWCYNNNNNYYNYYYYHRITYRVNTTCAGLAWLWLTFVDVITRSFDNVVDDAWQRSRRRQNEQVRLWRPSYHRRQ